MIQEEPKFFKSKYFVNEPCNWHLKKGAPKEIQEEFDAFVKAMNSQYADRQTETKKNNVSEASKWLMI
jgi:hypothetical protein